MAEEIFYGLSKAELKKEIDCLVEKDNRSLPAKAKVFSAVAKLQRFDMLPDVSAPEDLTGMIEGGAVELQRGISSNSGIPARLYAGELVRGPLFPGTLTASGQGIYLATTSVVYKDHPAFPNHPAFPKFSHVAHKYAKKEAPGIIVRCALKKDAKISDTGELSQFLRENKNRAKDVFGALDLGTFAASLGIDGYSCDHCEHPGETTWVIVNRSALVFQTIGLQVSQ